MEAGDLAAAASLHGRELPHGFLTQLGVRFLRQYLRTFLEVPGGVAVVVEDPHGSVAGFVVGSVRNGHHRAALRSCWRHLLPAALLAMVLRPGVLVRFLRTRAGRYARSVLGSRRPTSPDSSISPERPTGDAPMAAVAVLLHVAVEPSSRGQGYGRLLVESFLDSARTAGCAGARLVSFGDTGAFYAETGWQRLHARQDGDGRQVVSYAHDL